MSLVLLALHSDEGRLAAILAAVGMTALRRLQPSGERKERSIPDGLANKPYPPLCCPSKSAPVREESARRRHSRKLALPHVILRDSSALLLEMGDIDFVRRIDVADRL
jgi:hypothetical protein